MGRIKRAIGQAAQLAWRRKMREVMQVMRVAVTVAVWLVCCFALVGCLVAGYSSGGGLWVWPGSIVITLVIVLIWFLSRR